jgi:3-oxoacyl-[acyl-carrier-protein] synthase-1
MTLAGHQENFPNGGRQMLTDLYKKYVGDYPKFYKMDLLARLGFIATELLLLDEGEPRFRDCSDRAVVMVGHSGSVVADRRYLESISDADDYFPSPERFVYTLPNIVTGEVAIRNQYHGETGFYLLTEKNRERVDELLSSAFLDAGTQSVIGGWINCDNDNQFEADLCIIKRK